MIRDEQALTIMGLWLTVMTIAVTHSFWAIVGPFVTVIAFIVLWVGLTITFTLIFDAFFWSGKTDAEDSYRRYMMDSVVSSQILMRHELEKLQETSETYDAKLRALDDRVDELDRAIEKLEDKLE